MFSLAITHAVDRNAEGVFGTVRPGYGLGDSKPLGTALPPR